MPVSGINTATNHSSTTITKWLGHLRRLLGESLTECEIYIEGKGIVVEIDETKMGKRKFDRYHQVECV